MEYKIVEREKFKLLAKVKAFRNECVSEDGNTEIPDFWKQSSKDGIFDVLNKHTNNLDTYGVCAPISKFVLSVDKLIKW